MPEQNGMVERVIRTLKEQCAHRQKFETLQHASRVMGDWIQFYNQRRPSVRARMFYERKQFI
jgi:putative transposase